MSSRKPIYGIEVTLLAMLLSAPHVIFCGWWGWEFCHGNPIPFPQLGGFGWMVRDFGKRGHFHIGIGDMPFWNDKFFCVVGGHPREGSDSHLTYSFQDPETGERTNHGTRSTGWQPFVAGDRMWFVGKKEPIDDKGWVISLPIRLLSSRGH